MKKKKWELAAMTAVTAFLMLGTKAEAMDDAYRMPQLSGVTKTWVYQGETSDQNWERMLADDQEDGDLTSVIKSSGSVNTSKNRNLCALPKCNRFGSAYCCTRYAGYGAG